MDSLHIVIAGDADPVAVRRLIGEDTRRALLELHVTGETAAIEQLHALGLATAHRPNLFVATEREARQVSEHARSAGAELAAIIERRWDQLATVYAELEIVQRWPFEQAALLVIGDFVLDVGLLDALAADGSLMPPAPLRVLGTLPPSRYCLWLIEGPPHLLGQYGQRQIDLPWDGWTLTTYGQYFVDGAPNVARQLLIDQAMEATAQATDAADLAASLRLPLISLDDMNRWQDRIAAPLSELVAVYGHQAAAIRSLHTGLSRGIEAEQTFGEFFCWYDHLAYAHAVDLLAARGRFSIPQDRFTAAILRPWSKPDTFAGSG